MTSARVLRPKAVRGWLHERLPRMLPGGKPDRLPLTIHGRRIYILPTRAGLFFGLLLTVMLLGSLNYNNNLALLLTFLLGGVLLIAPVHTYRNLAGIRVGGCRAEPVFAGQRASFRIHLFNDGDQARCALRARTDRDADRADLDPAGEAHLTLSRPARERGWLSAPRVRIFTEYPLGLYHAWTWLDEPGQTLVYPAPEKNPPPLPYGGTAVGSDSRQEQEEEFVSVREYRHGDPARLIAWKAFARTNQLMSKEFLSPKRQSVWLDFERLQGLPLESRLSRLTAWVLEAHRLQLDYGLKLPDREFTPSHSDSHRLACLEALALFRQ